MTLARFTIVAQLPTVFAKFRAGAKGTPNTRYNKLQEIT